MRTSRKFLAVVGQTWEIPQQVHYWAPTRIALFLAGGIALLSYISLSLGEQPATSRPQSPASQQAPSASSQPSTMPCSESPDKSLSVIVIEDAQHHLADMRLISTKAQATDLIFPLTAKARTWKVPKLTASCLWSEDSQAVAIPLSDGKDAELYIAIKGSDGSFKATDITRGAKGDTISQVPVEQSKIVRSLFIPLKWDKWNYTGERQDIYGGWALDLTGRCWDKKGQRYSPGTRLFIGPNGQVCGR